MHKALENMLRLQELTRESQMRHRRSKVLDAEIKRVRHRLPGDLLRNFDHLLAHRRTSVAALSETGACGACHLMLPPNQILHIGWAAREIHTCPHCGCYLYALPVHHDGERRAA
jgi:predicted  nucleic acid-binding Zn-ribbon protein